MDEYTPVPYPRMLYKSPGTPNEERTIVPDEDGEDAARAMGWHGYHEHPEVVGGEVPTAPRNRGGRPRKHPRE